MSCYVWWIWNAGRAEGDFWIWMFVFGIWWVFLTDGYFGLDRKSFGQADTWKTSYANHGLISRMIIPDEDENCEFFIIGLEFP